MAEDPVSLRSLGILIVCGLPGMHHHAFAPTVNRLGVVFLACTSMHLHQQWTDWVWWCTLTFPTLWKWRQEDQKLKTFPGYTESRKPACGIADLACKEIKDKMNGPAALGWALTHLYLAGLSEFRHNTRTEGVSRPVVD